MSYVINSIDGELQEYAFDFGGVVALRNFSVHTNGNRLIVRSTENANFTILDALVNEVEIDGVVYNNAADAQAALQELVFSPAVPVLMTTAQRLKLEGIETGAQVNVQSDFNETDTQSPKFIKNKPGLATQTADGLMGKEDKKKIQSFSDLIGDKIGKEDFITKEEINQILNL